MQRKGIFRAFILQKLFWVSPVSIPEPVVMVGSPAVLLQMAWESVIVLRLGKNGASYLVSENLLSEGL